MKTYNNELSVTRGESFTLDFEVKNPDGSPYIVSSRLLNPHWLITVANSRYNQLNRYLLNKWLKVNDLGFISTNAIKYDGDFADNTYPDTAYGDNSGYANAAVYYNDAGYKYFKFTNPGDTAHQGMWVDYKAPRIIVPYDSDETALWTEQDYLYNIALVDGAEDPPFTVYSAVIPIITPTRLTVTTRLTDTLL